MGVLKYEATDLMKGLRGGGVPWIHAFCVRGGGGVLWSESFSKSMSRNAIMEQQEMGRSLLLIVFMEYGNYEIRFNHSK